MPGIRAGASAGFLTVAFTTAIILIGRRAGVVPLSLDLRDLAPFVDRQAHPAGALLAGIALHLVAGALIGAVYGRLVPAPSPLTGVLFMLLSWLALMLVVLPLAGRGLFGRAAGPGLPVATFVLHVVFGLMMGALARGRPRREESTALTFPFKA